MRNVEVFRIGLARRIVFITRVWTGMFIARISRSAFAARTSRIVFVASVATLLMGAGAASASAATEEVNCANLQQTITALAKEALHGEDDTLVLDELCDASNLKSSSGVTLPSDSDFAIEGKQGTTAGFAGPSISGPLMSTSGSEEVGAMTLANLTFEHAQAASALSIRAARLNLSHDNFLENEEQGENSHAAAVYVGQSQADCPPADGPPALAVTGSRFIGNKLTLGSAAGGGAGALLQDSCPLSRNVLEGNTFEANTLEAAGTAEGTKVTGAGLWFVGGTALAVPVSQSANVFDSNRILAAAPSLSNYGGGGEWLEGASLQAIGDRFSRNTIAGTSSSSFEQWSWGAGLGVNDLAFVCSQAQFPESTLENAVVEGNAIGPGTEADLGGGGIWVGCTHLRLLDSTVTLNKAPNGSGIEGEHGDQLELANSIVAKDYPGSEIAGFEGKPGAALTASFSDVCAAAGSSAPLPGAGNICADPLLADDGEPSSFDIHEAEASPTIDAGSNALLPAGLTTDFYGNQRVLSGASHTPACKPPEFILPILDAPVVNMGASEYGPIAVPAIAVYCKVTPIPPLTPGTQSPQQSTQPTSAPTGPSAFALSLPSVAQLTNGRLTLAFKGLPAGRVHVRASFASTDSVVTFVKGHRQRMRKTVTLTYGETDRSIDSSGNATLELQPTKRALESLTHSRHLRVHLSIMVTAATITPATRSDTIIVAYRRPARL